MAADEQAGIQQDPSFQWKYFIFSPAHTNSYLWVRKPQTI